MLSGEVIERGEMLPVTAELGDRLGVFAANSSRNRSSATAASLRVGLPWSLQSVLARGCSRFGTVSSTGAITQRACLPAPGTHHVGDPRPQRAVADHHPRLVDTAGLEVAHHRGPAVGALAVAVLDREQFLDTVLAYADDDQQA